MNPRINYTLVGAFVILMVAVGVGMLALMTRDDRQTQWLPYVTYFNESVAGLNERATVRFLGVPVGIVESITLDKEQEGRVRLGLKIDPSVPIRESSIASLQNQGITGLLFVEIQSGQADSPRLETSDASPAVIRSSPSRLLQISEALNETLSRFNQLSDNLSELTRHLSALSDDSMRQQLNSLIESMVSLSQTAERQLDQLDTESWDRLARSMTELADSLTQQSQALPDEMASFRQLLADNLDQTNRQLMAMSRDSQVLARELAPLIRETRALSETLMRQGDVLIRGPGQLPAGPGE
ncbi:MAG: MCE family protein [Oceanospirillales bacterium]|jgi:phospholipid/cholesterol/gamma-HCH transport system substrate-binding protein|nr:MAG: MCE family protein [Oceanospirillales bacterium]